MQVGVEHPVAHDLPEHGAEQRVGGGTAYLRVKPRDQFGGLRHGRTVEALHHDQPRRGMGFIDPGDAYAVAGERGPHSGHVVDLHAVVELLPQGIGEAVGQTFDADRAGPGCVAVERAGESVEDFEILRCLGDGSGPLDLDHHVAPVGQGRAMHLGNPGRGQRRLGHRPEDLVNRPGELGFEDRPHGLPRLGLGPVGECGELADEGFGEHVGAG